MSLSLMVRGVMLLAAMQTKDGRPMNANAADRLLIAHANADKTVASLYAKAGFKHSPKEICFRVFKREKLVEAWGTPEAGKPMKRFGAWTIAFHSGGLGPKRREGDGKVPEGLYVISAFNPQSNWWLSLRVSYPNASDRILSSQSAPGGDIYMHGGRASIGCLAMTDEQIEPIYLIALNARNSGQRAIRIDIFPSSKWAQLEREYASQPELLAFWKQLKAADRSFLKHKRPPAFKVKRDGAYVIAD